MDLYLATKEIWVVEQTLDIECPGGEFLNSFGQTWNDSFWRDNDNATVGEWAYEWNRIMTAMNCDDNTVDPEEAWKLFLLSE